MRKILLTIMLMIPAFGAASSCHEMTIQAADGRIRKESWISLKKVQKTLTSLAVHGLNDEGVKELAWGIDGDERKGEFKSVSPLGDYQNKGCLTSLDLSNGTISFIGAQTLVDKLRDDEVVQRLGLANNDIRAVGASHMAELVSSNHTLRYLNLNYNNIFTRGAEDLLGSLIDNRALEGLMICAPEGHYKPQIEKQIEQYFGPGRIIIRASDSIFITPPLILEHFPPAILNKGAEIKMNAVGGFISPEGWQAIRANAKTLRSLTVKGMSDSGLEVLLNDLGSIENQIYDLDLSDGTISSRGAVLFAKKTRYTSGLSRLNLANNYVRAAGAIALSNLLEPANVLCPMTVLSYLNLNNNNIFSIGADVLLGSVQRSRSLEMLEICAPEGHYDQETYDMAEELFGPRFVKLRDS